MKLNILLSLFACILFSSCENKATLEVQNNFSNVMLSNVGYSGATVASSLLPGASASREFSDYNNDHNFPITSYIEFNMSAKGTTIYLRTEQSYTLDKDMNLLIVLSDSTRVINPYSSTPAQVQARLKDFK